MRREIAIAVTNSCAERNKQFCETGVWETIPDKLNPKLKAIERAFFNKGDSAASNQLDFHASLTEIVEKIIDLQHDLMFFTIVAVVFVS